MTNKELFIEVIKRARREEIATNGLERALGYVEIKNDDLTACFSFCDKICGFLLFGRKDVPDYFYEVFGILYIMVLRITCQMALIA